LIITLISFHTFNIYYMEFLKKLKAFLEIQDDLNEDQEISSLS